MKFDIKLKNQFIPDEELFADLKRVAKKAKTKILPQKLYRKHGKFGVGTYTYRFGSWTNALAAVKLKSPASLTPSREELIKDLHRVFRKFKKQPTMYSVRRPVFKYTYIAYRNAFGNWNTTLHFLSLYQRNRKKFGRELAKLPEPKPPRSALTSEYRYFIHRRDGYRCVLCGRSPATDVGVRLCVDHIIPISKGGKTIPSNLRTLCMDCNLGKSAGR